LKLTKFEIVEKEVTAELEMSYEQEILKLKTKFQLPYIGMDAYKIFEDAMYPDYELGDRIGKIFLCIPQPHLRGIFSVLFNKIQHKTNWPMGLTTVKHPGFPAIAVHHNHSFLFRDDVQKICRNILDAIISGEYSSEEKPADRMEEDEEDEEDFAEEFVDETEGEKPSEWQDSPFDLGEVVEKRGDDDDDE
jgi:hypothetical protein